MKRFVTFMAAICLASACARPKFVLQSETGDDYPKCPEQKQKILIADLKSGWWAADGFAKTVIDKFISVCREKVEVEYHHIVSSVYDIPDDVDDEFPKEPWEGYTQIWVLSGAEEDTAGSVENDPAFKELLEEAPKSAASLFIGAGCGSIVHANALTKKLGLGNRFATSLFTEPFLFSIEAKIENYATPLAKTQGHALWTGISKIADEVLVNEQHLKGDYINVTSGLVVHAKNNAGKDSIASGTLGEVRKFVLDAGLQRYYSVGTEEGSSTVNFLENLVSYLAR